MAIFIAHGISPQKLRLLNEVRMAKEITWVSEILHASGKRLMPSSFTQISSPSRGEWPRTAHLDAYMMDLWEVSLRQCLLDPNGSIALQIRDPPGLWRYTKGVWMWSDWEKTLACSRDNTWEIWKTNSKQKSPYRGIYCQQGLREVFNGSHYA